MRARVAVLDDERRMAQVLGMVLRREGYAVDVFTRPGAFLEALEAEPFDLLVTDLKMPKIDGVEVLRRAKAKQPELPVILMTAHAEIKTAIAAIREGAFDYVEKPFDNDACKALVRRALEVTRLAREVRYLRAELRSRYALDQVVTVSEAMRQVFELARRAARSRATVLITGESGTGKELVARSIHYHSARVGEPFVAVNCKALASGVLESALFGHAKGAFTGANRAQAGVFERADGGTLFLDEIGEVSLDFQAKLLRVIQEREVVRVGEVKPRPVDARLVVATHRVLHDAVEAGRFREDLFFRLNVIPIRLPPLRERPEDVLPLARHFIQRWNAELGRNVRGWDAEVERFLITHAWPGNVRELENTLERGVVLARGDVLTRDDLLLGDATPHSVAAASQATAAAAQASHASADTMGLHAYLDHVTAERIKAALDASGGRKVEAARRLQIERTTLYRLMKRLGLS